MAGNPRAICFNMHLAILTTVTLACCLPIVAQKIARKNPRREKLPTDLGSWRASDMGNATYNAIWSELLPLLSQHGLALWRYDSDYHYSPEGPLQPDNYFYFSANKTHNKSSGRAKKFIVQNCLSHIARTTRGIKRDCVLRVMTAGGQGLTSLRILRFLSQFPGALSSRNHVLPLIDEIVYQDITICVFPRLPYDLESILLPSYNNSVEDFLHMFLQALEGIAYLHENRIAHRDMFLDNCVVQWLPASLAERSTVTRPRVYIIDFESAIDFPENSRECDRLCTGVPLLPKEYYGRARPPELESDDQPYSPFSLDVWQIAYKLHESFYPTKIEEVDKLLLDLLAPLPADRPTASDAVQRLDGFLRQTVPSSLHIPLLISEDDDAN